MVSPRSVFEITIINAHCVVMAYIVYLLYYIYCINYNLVQFGVYLFCFLLENMTVTIILRMMNHKQFH